jgi:unsaturated chondroitin disaccharide hydrolase
MPSHLYDSSAASIAAAGMLHLAEALGDSPAAARYRQYGLHAVTRLCSTEFVAADDEAWEGVLLHAIYHQRKNIGVDESVMWGDYYFAEALEAAERLSKKFEGS